MFKYSNSNNRQPHSSGHAHKLLKITDKQYYNATHQMVVQPKWTLQESILLYYLCEMDHFDESDKNMKLIHAKYNHVVRCNDANEVILSEKSINQIHGKYKHLFECQQMYNRRQEVEVE